MSNPFNAFYDVNVNICSVKSGSGYSNRGITKETQLAAFTVDLQPYNGGLAEKQYGLTVKCQYRMFCDTCEHITEGNYVEYGGKLYRIVYAAKWKYGDVAILKREE